MTRAPVAGLRARVGETVMIAGWARALRLQRAIGRSGSPPASGTRTVI